MAIPTDFQGFTPAADTTKSFKILGSATVGVWGMDVDGSLSASSKQITLASDFAIFMTAAYTDAQIAALLKDYLKRLGQLREDGAGGAPTEGSKLTAISATTCT